jgi:hypothetical protein
VILPLSHGRTGTLVAIKSVTSARGCSTFPFFTSGSAQGIGADGSEIVHESLNFSAPPEVTRVSRPEGDVPWASLVHSKSDSTVAASLIAALQGNTARLLDVVHDPTTSSSDGAASSPARKLRSAKALRSPLLVSSDRKVISKGFDIVTDETARAGARSETSGRPPGELARLKLEDPRYVMKVSQDRLYDVHFHPGTDRIIAICSSKSGSISLWCPDAGVSSQHDSRQKVSEESEVETTARISNGDDDDADKTVAEFKVCNLCFEGSSVPCCQCDHS